MQAACSQFGSSGSVSDEAGAELTEDEKAFDKSIEEQRGESLEEVSSGIELLVLEEAGDKSAIAAMDNKPYAESCNTKKKALTSANRCAWPKDTTTKVPLKTG